MTPLPLPRRLVLGALTATAVAALAGCVGLPREMAVSVQTWGDWPTARVPASTTYAFERLPSQQSRPEAQQTLEDAATPALARTGLQPVPQGQLPDVLVQVGARVSRSDASPWDEPIWWGGGFGRWHLSPWRGMHWNAGMTWSTPRYDREAAILIRDRASGKPLYEARGSSEGYGSDVRDLLPLLYEGALRDFPATGINPRTVRVPLAAP